jgi:hypothetical protein
MDKHRKSKSEIRKSADTARRGGRRYSAKAENQKKKIEKRNG